MNSVTMTTQEIADKMGLPKETAYLLLQYMEKTRLISRAAENRKPPNGKGQGQVVYIVTVAVCQRVKQDLERLFASDAPVPATP